MHSTDQPCGVLAIGNLIVDKTHRISCYPAESFLAVISSSSSSPGGGAVNVLFDLARVDPQLPLFIAGTVGDDEDGRLIRSEFKARAIDATRIVTVPDKRTSFTHVMISETNATRTFFHSHGANSRIDLEFIRALAAPARIVHLAYLLLLEGLDVADAKYGAAGAHALAVLQAKGFRTSLDLVSDGDPDRYRRFIAPALPYTDYLIINDIEAANLTGSASATANGSVDWDAAFAQAHRLLGMGVGELVAIHFPQGAVAVTRSGQTCGQGSYAVPKAQVVSALGAGDAFCAGMLYGLHEGYDLPMCIKLGGALAHYNLFAASAIDGAVPLSKLVALIGANAPIAFAASQ
jgi:sugar/nucleoside kinase (ribokinase family)